MILAAGRLADDASLLLILAEGRLVTNAHLLLILAEGRRSKLARDLARSASKSCNCGVSDTTQASGFTAGARQIVGKPDSHALRAEAARAFDSGRRPPC